MNKKYKKVRQKERKKGEKQEKMIVILPTIPCPKPTLTVHFRILFHARSSLAMDTPASLPETERGEENTCP